VLGRVQTTNPASRPRPDGHGPDAGDVVYGAFVDGIAGAFVDGIAGAFVSGIVGAAASCFWQPVNIPAPTKLSSAIIYNIFFIGDSW
jgi:hypothetical protein